VSPSLSILIAGGLALLCWPAGALAFESTPEFQSLTEEEASAFEGPERLGSEYTSDVHSYSKPLGWEYAWLTSDIVFDGAVGSTSAVHFMLDARLKARAVIVPERLEFRFTWFDESHREREARHAVLEIVGWLHPWVGLSVYGEPSLYKRKADLGGRGRHRGALEDGPGAGPAASARARPGPRRGVGVLPGPSPGAAPLGHQRAGALLP
jgi:hypothetical protein